MRKFKNNNFRIEIGQRFKSDKIDLTIIDRESRENKDKQIVNWYKFKCNICGWDEGWKTEKNIFIGYRCGCCSNKMVVAGINDIATISPEIVIFFKNKEEAKKYAKTSNAMIPVVCPNCKREKEIDLRNLYRTKSIGCICSDKISCPEKILLNLLDQLKVKYIPQLSRKTFKWVGNYRYDFYIPKYNMIIETHGAQHYREIEYFKMSLKETQTNDMSKEMLARYNGVDNYIVLDCRESNLEYIKKSILTSDLANIFDMSIINWKECEEFAFINKNKKSNSKSGIREKKKVIVFKNGECKGEFNSISELARESEKKFGVKFIVSGINMCCRNKRSSHKGYIIKYKDEGYNQGDFKELYIRKKKVEVFKGNVSLGIFSSCSELSRQSFELFNVKMSLAGISRAAREDKKEYKGYQFRYI